MRTDEHHLRSHRVFGDFPLLCSKMFLMIEAEENDNRHAQTCGSATLFSSAPLTHAFTFASRRGGVNLLHRMLR